MDNLVKLLNLQLTCFRSIKTMVIDTNQSSSDKVKAAFWERIPSPSEQERVGEYLRQHNTKFSPDWFGNPAYHEFSNLWRKFAVDVNNLILKDLDQIKPLGFQQEETILHETIKDQLNSWSKEAQSVLYWEEMLSILDQQKDIDEDPTKGEYDLEPLEKEEGIYRSKLFEICGIDFWDLGMDCMVELKQLKFNFQIQKDPSIRRCQAFATTQTAACHKFFEFKRQPGVKNKYCSDRCEDRTKKFKKRTNID